MASDGQAATQVHILCTSLDRRLHFVVEGAYCDLCPFKHCWMEKSMGATGNVILHRLSEVGTEIEINAEGGIVARIAGPDGEEIKGRGTLCSLSALTNMLLRGDAQKILKPSSAKNWDEG
jgi:hypothetical protein